MWVKGYLFSPDTDFRIERSTKIKRNQTIYVDMLYTAILIR